MQTIESEIRQRVIGAKFLERHSKLSLDPAEAALLVLYVKKICKKPEDLTLGVLEKAYKRMKKDLR